ncbi:MAG: recombination mediator RecR [Chlamydiota bacterium]
MLRYPKNLLTLIAHLKKLPGAGKKTAERYAFHLLEWEGKELCDFAEGLATLKEKVRACTECGCLMDGVRCTFCTDHKRDRSILCIIANPRDAYAVEETGDFCGMYHVLGALLSPINGTTPDDLNLPHLQERIRKLEIKEAVLALDATIEGDATSLFLKERLVKMGAEVSRLALGLPIGSSLDFVDEGTLSQAFSGRQKF